MIFKETGKSLDDIIETATKPGGMDINLKRKMDYEFRIWGGMSTNLKDFYGAVKGGAKDAEAAFSTWSGQQANEHCQDIDSTLYG